MTRVVAVVPAKDRADSVGDTVTALRTSVAVDDVLVVDDGSTDDTASVALAAGARVMRLPRNRGKGGAVTAGVNAAAEADVYLLIDADTASSAAVAGALLEPVLAGRADMTVGVLPSAGSRGGFGRVRALAAAGIRRGCGFEARAPLSGQRAVRGELLRSLLPLAPRFGMEVALTVDAVRAGARVVEVDVPMEHRHTGRSLAGFRHRARQGVDIVRALWPRLTTSAFRLGAIALVFAVLAATALWQGSRWEPSSVAGSAKPSKVVLFGIPHLAWDDLDSGVTPTLDHMRAEGAVAALSVRTLTPEPTAVEGYATLGAGTRVKADEQAGLAFSAAASYEGGTAAEALARRTGTMPNGDVVVVGAAATDRLNQGRHLSSEVGALGSALRAGGKRTAVVGNSDGGALSRPTAVALMTKQGEVDAGVVDNSLLVPDLDVAFGTRADPARVAVAVRNAVATADVVLIDPGDTERASAMATVATPVTAAAARRAALARTDALLADTLAAAGPDAQVIAFSVTPPAAEWHLAPIVTIGPGVHRGYLHSLSTRREGVVTLTDLAPTVLDALAVPVPDGMIGKALRYRPGDGDLALLRKLDRDALFRERTYFRLTIAYIVVQALAYLLAILAFTRLGGVGRAGALLRWLVLAVAAWPLSTFLLRAIPDVAELGGAAVMLLLAIDAAVVWLALRAARRPLAPLGWIAGATVALLLADVWTGAHLQTSSILGYSLHTAARFTGLGNTAFAALAATTVLAVCIHVHHAPRRREALLTAAGVCGLVVMTDGAPSLGSDVGGILTLIPVFGLVLVALAGRRLSWKLIGVAGFAAVVALGGVAVLDYLRPADARTHLGQLVADVRADGIDPFLTTVNRKVAANLRTFRSPWTWAVPVIAGYLLWMLAWARGYQRLLPRGSALRAAAVGVLAAGILGNVVNDSGVVVTALVFVYLGPLLTLLALDGEDDVPVLLPAVHDVSVPS